VVGDQAAISGSVSKRAHDANDQLMRLTYIELHDEFHDAVLLLPFLASIATRNRLH
jgi:hypothetical protein